MSIQLAFLDAAPVRKGGMATVVFAGSVGTIIEWYDFFIYGTAAALVFNTLFFPNIDPLTGTLASLATFSVGFIARPIGGAIFGHFGDRIGRKVMLMITMVIMALATFAVGCLPTYQEIGVLGLDSSGHVAVHPGHMRRGRMGGRLPNGDRARTGGPTWPVRQPGADRWPPRAGDVFGCIRSGDDDAGSGFQVMGMAHPLPAQHPAAWRRLVRARARPGDADIRGAKTPWRDLKKSRHRGDFQESAQLSRGRGAENIGGVLVLHPHDFHRGVCDQPAEFAARAAVERDLYRRTGRGDCNSAIRLAVGSYRAAHLLFSWDDFHGLLRLSAVLAPEHQGPADHHPDRGCRSELGPC